MSPRLLATALLLAVAPSACVGGDDAASMCPPGDPCETKGEWDDPADEETPDEIPPDPPDPDDDRPVQEPPGPGPKPGAGQDLPVVDPVAPETCGDETIQDGEECDDGNSEDRDECTTACMYNRCGDRRLEPTEQCDDGNDSDDDRCDSECRFTGEACFAAETVACTAGESQQLVRQPTDETWTDVVDEYWGRLNEPRAEYSFVLSDEAASRATLRLAEWSRDLEIYVVANSDHGCVPGSLVGSGNEVTFDLIGGRSYMIVMERADHLSEFTLDVICE